MYRFSGGNLLQDKQIIPKKARAVKGIQGNCEKNMNGDARLPDIPAFSYSPFTG